MQLFIQIDASTARVLLPIASTSTFLREQIMSSLTVAVPRKPTTTSPPTIDRQTPLLAVYWANGNLQFQWALFRTLIKLLTIVGEYCSFFLHCSETSSWWLHPGDLGDPFPVHFQSASKSRSAVCFFIILLFFSSCQIWNIWLSISALTFDNLSVVVSRRTADGDVYQIVE